MIETRYTCGIAVFDRRRLEFRTCGAKARRVVEVHGDTLLPICHRHNGRISRAFPGIVREPAHAQS